MHFHCGVQQVQPTALRLHMEYALELHGTHAPSRFTEQTIPLRSAGSLLYSSVHGSIRYRHGSTGLRSPRAQMMHDLIWTALSRQAAFIRKLIFWSKGNSCAPNRVFKQQNQHKQCTKPSTDRQLYHSVRVCERGKPDKCFINCCALHNSIIRFS